MSEVSNRPPVPATVLVLAYNTPDLLARCLEGFWDSCTAMGWQILVVDNGSEADVRSVIDERFGGIDVIRNERNLGFAGGNNIGLRRAEGEFVILMNSDVVARAEVLEGLVDATRADPRIGAMSPGLLTAGGKPQEFAFGSRPAPGYLIRRGIRRLLGLRGLHDWAVQKPIDVDWVSAACICVRRRVIEEVGDLDERFPLYFEDTDWGLRMRAAGWRVVYNPLLRVTHLGGASQIRRHAESRNLYYRSLLLFCEKHYGRGWKLLLQTLLTWYRVLARAKLRILETFGPADARSVKPEERGVETGSARPGIQEETGELSTQAAKGEESRAAACSTAREPDSTPEFSVIMPVWNRADSVARAIESVMKQTFDNYEIVILDDGSTDNLEKVIAPFLSSAVFYYKTRHRGLPAARNAALSHARGRYIAYLDSDNRWDPRFLDLMYESLNRKGTSRHVAYCMYRLYSKDRRTGECSLRAIRGEEFSFTTLLKRNYIDVNSLVHSRESANQTGAWDETLTRLSDWDYMVRLTSRYNPVFIPRPMVDYYLGFESNALTLNYREREYRKVVLRKNSNYRHSIAISHDSIPYRFSHVSEKKYRNWSAMNQPPRDTSGFFANGYPYMLQVEPTNRCNLACPFCPSGRRELEREGRDMRFEEYKPLVDELADYLLLLVLYDWGEPLLNPDFPKMVQYANERGIRTMTSTNGHALNNEAFVAEVLKAGLDTLVVAVDSLDQKTYELFRRNGNIEKVLNGIRKTVALKRRVGAKTRINMRMVVTRNNEGELPKMRSMARSLGVDIFSVKTVNPNSGGLLDDDAKIVPADLNYRRYKYRKGTMDRVRIDRYCHYVWTLANIAADGTVVGCCYDYDGRMALGNIHMETFNTIWNGQAAREIRKRIWMEKDSIPRCRDCDLNFALSRGGWFPEYIDFTSGPFERVRQNIRRSFLAPAARKLIRLIR